MPVSHRIRANCRAKLAGGGILANSGRQIASRGRGVHSPRVMRSQPAVATLMRLHGSCRTRGMGRDAARHEGTMAKSETEELHRGDLVEGTPAAVTTARPTGRRGHRVFAAILLILG